MKKETGFILFLSVCLTVFVMGFPGLSHAQPNDAKKQCHQNNGKGKIKKVTEEVAGADAVAIFILKADGSIQVMEGPGKNAKKPKKDGGGPIDQQPNSSTPIEWKDLPDKIKDDFPKGASNIKMATITAYSGDTCTNVNGTWYCW